MANNDNAMTRFLFAILQQKCLKDIDWNKVAHDPNLAQPITNGHAARMRYSRFRSAMLGIEPQRRNRVTKPSATKKKKTTAGASTTKKGDGDGETQDTPINSDNPSATKKIKLEKLSPSPQSPQQQAMTVMPTPTATATPAIRSEIDTVKIKQERSVPSPPTTGAMSMPGTPIDTSPFANMMHPHRQSPTPTSQTGYGHTMRLLTPCSDHQSPVSVQAQASDLLMHHNLTQGFMTATHSSPLSSNHDFHHQHHHHGSQSQTQSPYDHHTRHFDTAVASASSPWGHSHLSQSRAPSVSMYSPTTPVFGYPASSAAATNCDHTHSQHTQHSQYSQQQQTQGEHSLGLMGIGMGLPMNTMNMNLGGMNMGQIDFNNMVMPTQRASMSPVPTHPIKGENTAGSPHWGTMDAGFV
ncbi:hypothetical protein B0T21DRAFT_359961 [Apiosordaria backusii]|uniref:Myb-like DNA-binding domain-containing protein n=1 Tax=Apiosordaria backusii TaxID=314023 RepID=A0AA40ELU9_9PEZI|nr:hypothetical protein B0T21DRAFT_359961 [Apiosordaria backusii]